MDSQNKDASMQEPVDATDEIEELDDLDEMDEEGEEVEITREELVAALQEVVSDLSTGLRGDDRDAYLSADDLAQNDWFFAGVSDEDGKYSVTMWPAEGEEDMLRIDIGTEDEVHGLASNPEQVDAMTDDFITAMEEDLDDEYEEYDEELDEEDDEDFDDEELEEDEAMAEDELAEDETVSRDGNLPPR